MTPPILQVAGPMRLGGFVRMLHPVVDLAACRADIEKRTGTDACSRSGAAQAAEYHSRMRLAGATWWQSAEYLVQATMAGAAGFQFADHLPALWLRIYRHDGERLSAHWQDLQRIKNELVGAEAEAVEVYPKESQLKDGENSYHLWVPLGWALPFGMPGGRAETADGIPAVSTRFVRAKASGSGRQPHIDAERNSDDT